MLLCVVRWFSENPIKMKNTRTEQKKLKNLKNWCKRHIKKQKGCYQEGAVYETMDYLEAWSVIDKINELMNEK